MTFRTRCEVAKGNIDPAPMVDVVFLLLIFIVLSSPYVLQPGFRTDLVLPTSSNPPGGTFQGLVVTVSRDNLVFFDKQLTTVDALPQLFRKAVRESHNPELIIKADQNVSYGTTVKIMSMAREAGISAVNLATRPEVSGPSPAR